MAMRSHGLGSPEFPLEDTLCIIPLRERVWTTLKSFNVRNPHSFLIVDVTPYHCSLNSCETFSGWLREAFPGSKVQVQLFPDVSGDCSPDIVFLRSTSPDLFSDALFFIKNKWRNTPIVAIFCVGWDQPREVAESFLSGLDDFLTCPFGNRGVELSARVWRLLQSKIINATPNAPKAQHSCFGKLVGDSVT
ncbi:MAG: hypothetical protein WCH75_07050, partial [Candidatus Binatia bacterium]